MVHLDQSTSFWQPRLDWAGPLTNPMGTQNSTGVGARLKFHPWVRVQIFSRHNFFTGQIFGPPDLNPTHCYP
jgi:hypothetical protein